MAQQVESEWAKQVLEWWIEHADAALLDGRARREHAFGADARIGDTVSHAA